MCSTAPKNTCLNPTLSFPFNQVFSHSKGVFRYLYSLTNCFPSEASGMEPSNSSFSPILFYLLLLVLQILIFHCHNMLMYIGSLVVPDLHPATTTHPQASPLYHLV